jgi:hypothetical protein
MAQQSLLAAARAIGAPVDSVMVKVKPPSTPPVAAPPSPKPLSRASAQHLRAAARSLSDPELHDLFLKLASVAEVPDFSRKTD